MDLCFVKGLTVRKHNKLCFRVPGICSAVDYNRIYFPNGFSAYKSEGIVKSTTKTHFITIKISAV